jgi:hypothetical protein
VELSGRPVQLDTHEQQERRGESEAEADEDDEAKSPENARE